MNVNHTMIKSEFDDFCNLNEQSPRKAIILIGGGIIIGLISLTIS